jgi:hypothetical protein
MLYQVPKGFFPLVSRSIRLKIYIRNLSIVVYWLVLTTYMEGIPTAYSRMELLDGQDDIDGFYGVNVI